MAKGEESLFEGLDLEAISTSSDDDTIDTVEFTQGTEEQGNEGGNDPQENEEPQGTSEEIDNEDDGVDPAIFESTEPNNEKGNNSEDSPLDNTSSPLQVLATTLQSKGLISLEEDEKIEDVEGLLSAYEKTLKNNEFSDLNENQRAYVEALRNGIPEEEVKQNFKDKEALSNINDTAIEANENLRKVLITQDFIAKGLNPEKAEKLATRSVELGEDLEDAKEAYKSLVDITNAKLEEKNKKAEAERKAQEEKNSQKLAELKTTILEKDEFIPGYKPNATTKNKIFENMTKVVGKDENGTPITAITKARLEDPDTFEMMESFLFTVTKGFKDWSSFKNKVKSASVEDLEKALASNQSGSGTPTKIKGSTGGILDALEGF